jgi:hypothetical protein
VQTALASQQQQQHDALPNQHAHSPGAATAGAGSQQPGPQQPSDLLHAMQDQSKWQSGSCSTDRLLRHSQHEQPAADTPASRQLSGKAGASTNHVAFGQLHSQQATVKSHSKLRAWLHAGNATPEKEQQLQPVATCAAAAHGSARQPQTAQKMTPPDTKHVAEVGGGVSRKTLNDREVDVVLKLIGALHGTQ